MYCYHAQWQTHTKDKCVNGFYRVASLIWLHIKPADGVHVPKNGKKIRWIARGSRLVLSGPSTVTQRWMGTAGCPTPPQKIYTIPDLAWLKCPKLSTCAAKHGFAVLIRYLSIKIKSLWTIFLYLVINWLNFAGTILGCHINWRMDNEVSIARTAPVSKDQSVNYRLFHIPIGTLTDFS